MNDPAPSSARPVVAIVGTGGGGLLKAAMQIAEASASPEFFQALDAAALDVAAFESGRRLATVEEITSISEIPDADNIVVARVRGWDVVVRRGEFIPGDRCVYFEVDSMLDVTDERYAFLEPRGVRTDARVYGNAQVSGNARVEAPRHVLTVGPIGSEDQYATLARTEAGHLLTVGCWRNGTIDDLKAEVMRRAPQCWPEYREVRRLLRLRLAGWDAERAAAAADEAVTA